MAAPEIAAGPPAEASFGGSGDFGGERGGFGGRGRGGRGGRGRGGRGRGGGRGRDRDAKAEWVPVTKLGRLVKADRVTTLEEIYLHSLPVKEAAIIDHIFARAGKPVPERSRGEAVAVGSLEDQVMKIMPVQKQTTAGQRTRFKAFVAIGDRDGHIGLGVKCSSEVTIAIQAAIGLAKLSLVPIRRGYWGSRLGSPHTVPSKVTGKCGSVRVRLIPAPRGTGLVAAPANKKMLELAGISDCYTSARGHTRTMGNFIKATFFALRSTYGYLSPDLWNATAYIDSPYQAHNDFLSNKFIAASKYEDDDEAAAH